MATTAVGHEALAAAPGEKTGLWSWITTVDHKRVAILYLIGATVFFFLGGIEPDLLQLHHSPHDRGS
jgi:cytochrome c oxidase subunit I